MRNYVDRQQAGLVLAELLEEYTQQKATIVLALPRGGVPVAYEIARHLALPLDILIVRKLGVPSHVEYAMGAIAPGNVVVLNEEAVAALHIKKSEIDKVLHAEQEELIRRELVYRGNKPYSPLEGKTIILVDDGIATGYSMRAALASIAQKKPAATIVAVPVAARSTCRELARFVTRVICPLQPENFYAVGLWYDNFSQTTDEEVVQLMEASTW